MSIANALRSRGIARGLGVAPSGFDMSATVLTPGRHGLGGWGQLAPPPPGAGPTLYGSQAPTVTALANRQYMTAISPGTVQPSPLIGSRVAPAPSGSGWSPGELPFTDGGVSTASDRVTGARGSTSPALRPGDPSMPAPSVRINGPISYDGDTYTAGPVPTNVSITRRLPFGWPWWVWAAVAVGGGIGVYALTTR